MSYFHGYCPDILDFEASGFGPDSYPLEVGYSFASGERFCVLIRPHPTWQHWDARAEQVHGISQSLLRAAGRDVREVCDELNGRLEGRTVFSDAWVTDKAWLNRLYDAAGVLPRFQLSAIENVQTECQHLMWDEVRTRLLQECDGARHRASSDAAFIQRVFQQTQLLCASTQAK